VKTLSQTSNQLNTNPIEKTIEIARRALGLSIEEPVHVVR
jgi:hypothetical protein